MKKGSPNKMDLSGRRETGELALETYEGGIS